MRADDPTVDVVRDLPRSGVVHRYVRLSSPDEFDGITPTHKRASTIAMISRKGSEPLFPHSRGDCRRSCKSLASAVGTVFGTWEIAKTWRSRLPRSLSVAAPTRY